MEAELYCCTCGKMARCMVNDHMHLVPERAFAVCDGPFAFCPPPDEGAISFLDEEAEDQDNPFTYDDVRFDP